MKSSPTLPIHSNTPLFFIELHYLILRNLIFFKFISLSRNKLACRFWLCLLLTRDNTCKIYIYTRELFGNCSSLLLKNQSRVYVCDENVSAVPCSAFHTCELISWNGIQNTLRKNIYCHFQFTLLLLYNYQPIPSNLDSPRQQQLFPCH